MVLRRWAESMWDNTMPRAIIICEVCGEEKKHCAHGLCRQCYAYRWNRGIGLPKQKRQGPKKIYHSRKWLGAKYCQEKLSGRAIAELAGVSKATIYRWLRDFNIPARKAWGMPPTGPDSPHWKGGRIKIPTGYIRIYAPKHPNTQKSGYSLSIA